MPDDTTKTDNQIPNLGTEPTNQPDPVANPVPPVPPAVDAPPPPIQDGAESPPPPIVEEEKPKDEKKPDSPTTPDIPPVISTSDSGGRKPVSRKMIATILGVLVLVGGIGAGVILVQRQQDIREKAYVVNDGGDGIPTYSIGDRCVTGISPTGYFSCELSNGCDGTFEIKCVNNVWVATQCVDNINDNCPRASSPTCYEDCISAGNTPIECSGLDRCITVTCYEDCISAGNTPIECSGLDRCTGCYEDCISAGNTPIECSGLDPCAETDTETDTETNTCYDKPEADYCNSSGCNVGDDFRDGCWVNRYHCTTVSPGGCSGSANLTSDVGVRSATFQEDCGTEQIDTTEACPKDSYCENTQLSDFVSRNYDRDCDTTTRTTTPGLSCACLNIKAYDTEWNLIANTELSSLVAGDVVRFAVSGNASSGVIDMARFTINDVLGPEVTDKKPGTNEFYTEYTIPEGITSFKIEAELHHSEIGWF